MKQITIEQPKFVSNGLDIYAREYQTSSAIAHKAIEEFLLKQGYMPLKPFQLTPSP